MKLNFLRLDEDRVLVEQLRLMLSNVILALVPTILLAILLIWTLINESNSFVLITWGIALVLSKSIAALHARIRLATDIPSEKARRLVWELVFLNLVDGIVWGVFSWVTLDSTTLAGSILVIATMAGVLGSTMARLSPVLPVFITFVCTMLVIGAPKFWQLGDPAYDALGWASLFYLLLLMLMARNSARETRAAIDLRFENIGLLEKLKVKTSIAEHAKREAEEANTAKSKFLAAASHDLRQPIHAQGLFLELLSRSQLNEQQSSLLENALKSSRASSELLTTLLDFSRIEAGVIEPQLQPFSLQTLLARVEKELAPHARIKQLRYHTHPTKLTLYSDPALLERILRNLVTNAIRYTIQGGILVGCRQRGKQAVIEVWDTGIGIEKSQHKEIFREFHQLGNPERDRRKGLGLGLAIVQGLANTLQHKLTLDSKPGHGSVFRLTVPISTAAVAVNAEPVAVIESKLNGVTVLVVEDDEDVRIGMVHLLRDWGCNCEAAESIDEALELVKFNQPDIVISDYRLREHSTGIEAIRALRAVLDEALPAILITGDTAPDRLREAQESGLPLLHKPVSPQQLFLSLVGLVQAR